MVIEVPRLKDIPTDVTPNLQERLNSVTEVLSRVSKLVSEDLEKAVSSTLGQDKDGKLSVGALFPRQLFTRISPIFACVFSNSSLFSRFSSG